MVDQKNKIFKELESAMDIVRGMTQEEIRELLLNNPLYRFLIQGDEREEDSGIQKKSD